MIRSIARSTFGVAALVSAGLAIASLLVGLVAYELTHEAIEHQLDRRIETETRTLLAEPGPNRLVSIAAAIERRQATNDPVHLYYLLVDQAGRRLAGNLQGAAPERPGYEEFLHHGRDRVAQAITSDVAGGRLVVAADRQELKTTDRQLGQLFLTAFGILLLVGIGGAWTIGAITIRRLRRIDQTALAIIEGDFSRRVPVDGSGSEFDQVSGTLNRMLDRIAALMDNLRQVSSDVAHDLRTPLSKLRNRLEEAASAGTDQVRAERVASALQQSDDLLKIFTSLLRISEVEALGVRRQFKPVALGVALSEFVDTYRPEADASGHILVTNIDETISVDGDRRLLLQVASNLLQNAFRHTPAGTEVSLSLEAKQDAAVLTVSDNGPGVPPVDRERIFQRFARGEASRSSSGHGLGLALVRAIAEAHGGSARIMDRAGFVIEVFLPRSPLRGEGGV